ncbi:hypothetical protein EHS13_30640 [Paenibacillus psychroresistens]|uniref:Uncharacterized protein n=1 Tax=Paenibacillus psychroresistens TaxID=1778678 RepID=A0A6B8RUF9_9BACL|nr:DUF6022 family protein [Paenibacillus psychroresistens]QGQ98926.1 hypothetical protein EHS13_30640 [Paenibacillus psychroresistens]
MQTLKNYFLDEPESSIQSLVKYMNQALSEIWEVVLKNNEAELTQMFVDYGDRAYGAYIQKFMGEIGEQVNQAGYEMKAGFNLANSIESWGPPEERERCVWYVINDVTGTPLGSAILQIFHSPYSISSSASTAILPVRGNGEGSHYRCNFIRW